MERELVGGRAAWGDDERTQVHHAVDRFIPLDVGCPVHLEGIDGSEGGLAGKGNRPAQSSLNSAALCLQASDAYPEDRTVAPVALVAQVGETFGPGRPTFGPVGLAVGTRCEHAPLEAHLVLPGGSPVGVQDVPLVEDRVSHRPRRLETVLLEPGH